LCLVEVCIEGGEDVEMGKGVETDVVGVESGVKGGMSSNEVGDVMGESLVAGRVEK
jgi:hypothetical protein